VRENAKNLKMKEVAVRILIVIIVFTICLFVTFMYTALKLKIITVYLPKEIECGEEIAYLSENHQSNNCVLVDIDGNVWENSELERTNSYQFYKVDGIKDVIKIANGKLHSLALCSDGSVWAWGDNTYGQLGDGTNENREFPVKVQKLKDIMLIACGVTHSLAVDKNGDLWSWGDNEYYQLGYRSSGNVLIPTKVNNIGKVVDIACGSVHSLTLTEDGNVWAWGSNTINQLGIEGVEFFDAPQKIEGLKEIKDISCGYEHSLALDKYGYVWEWGGSSRISKFSTKIKDFSEVLKVACGPNHSIALKNDGSVWAWGSNFYGQIGVKESNMAIYPKKIEILDDIVNISGTKYSTIVQKKDHSVWIINKNNKSYNKLGFLKWSN